jgi:indolepyruvate ferredoxin oxidoreductase
MAYKDEYEVARLHLKSSFDDKLNKMFQPGAARVYHLAPPIFNHRDPATGNLKKRAFPAWVVRPMFHVLAGMKSLRGTSFDPFGGLADRKMERGLLVEFKAALEHILAHLNRDNHAQACQILAMIDAIRGYGHVKQKAYDTVMPKFRLALEEFAASKPTLMAAE